jgi:hypothetical protein
VSKDIKNTIFEDESEGFKAMIDMDRKVHQADVSVCVIQFQTTEAYCNLHLTTVKFTTYKQLWE